MKLVLFDLDGTLLSAAGAGRRAVHTALTEIFGSVRPADYWFDGKTDRQIVRELMRSDGFTDAEIDSRMEPLLDRYLACLSLELEACAERACALPGVEPLLEALAARPDVTVGVLTGNLERGASSKLRAVGIDPGRFVVGAYGSDHEERSQLPAIAQRRASARLGIEIPGHAVVIVGDTPADIACGRPIGARTVAVATGRFSVEELRSHSPAAVLDSLAKTDIALRAIVDA